MNMRSKRPVLPTLMGLVCTLLAGCGTEPPGADGGRVVLGMSDDVLATDPASGYDPGSWLLFSNVFQTLLSFPEGGSEPQPELAKECHFTDGRSRVYQCTLKEGLSFSNGDSLTAEDVKFSFERTLSINDAAGPAVLLSTVDSIDTPDETTVVFRLKVPDATFPDKVASAAGAIVDHRKYSGDGLREDGQAVGSGPYTLASFDKGTAVFAVNDRYRGTAEVHNRGVTLKLYHGDQRALKEGLFSGDVDIAYRGLAPSDLVGIDEQGLEEGVDVIEGSSAEVQHLVFNMDHPVAGKIGVRRAMAYLLDRSALIADVYQGTATPLYSIVPAGILGHGTSFFDTYGEFPSKDKAAQALRDDGTEEKVRLTLWSTPSRYGPATDQEMQAIAAQLNASGLFDADVKSVPFDRYEKGIAAGQYGVYVKGWVPDYPDTDNFVSPFFGAGNVLDNRYTNTKISDLLVPRTAMTIDRSATEDDFAEIQEIVARDVPVLPVWQGKQYAVAKKSIRGLQYCLDASTVFRFWELGRN
ncbi:ABC transporter substrate-binding protein [Streptomyces sp. NPDC002740]